MRLFVTAVCVLFLIKLRWPKTKSIYDLVIHRFLVTPTQSLSLLSIHFFFKDKSWSFWEVPVTSTIDHFDWFISISINCSCQTQNSSRQGSADIKSFSYLTGREVTFLLDGIFSSFIKKGPIASNMRQQHTWIDFVSNMSLPVQ